VSGLTFALLLIAAVVIIALFGLVQLENAARRRQYEAELAQLRDAIHRSQS
jgi:hypothetical protein